MFHAGYMLFCLGLPPSHSCAIVWHLICMEPSNLEKMPVQVLISQILRDLLFIDVRII